MSRHGTYDFKYGFIPDDDCPQPQPITNADRIRAMSDEELAEYLSWVALEGCNGAVSSRGVWTKAEIVGGVIVPWIEWLKQETSDEG